MRSILVAIALVLVIPALPANAETVYQAVDLSSKWNARFQDADQRYVEGNVILGGVPFRIPVGGRNQWNFGSQYGDTYVGTTRTDFAIGVSGVREVHTLMHTAWGAGGPTCYLSLEFYGSQGAYYKKDLIGGVDIRDWNNWILTNTINGTTTICVESYGGGQRRRDKQCMTLPAEFLTQRLEYMRIVDSGAYNFQRGCLTGLSVLRDLPAQTVGLSNKAFGSAAVARSEPQCSFTLWGKAHIIDSSTLTIDDGSGQTVTIAAPGYTGITEGDYVRASGAFTLAGGKPMLTCPAARVRKL